MRRIALVLLLSTVSGRASADAGAVAPGSAPSVRVTDAGVSLDVRDAPRGDVLRALAAGSRIEVRGRLRDEGPVTATLADAPLDEALRRVLGEQSYLLVYGADGSPGALELLGSTGEALVVAAPPPGAAGERSEAERSAAGDAPPMPGSLRAHPVEGRLAAALGKPSASFNDVVAFASTTDDPGLQRAAVEAGFDILDAEPELKNAVLSTVHASSPTKLARYLVVATGPRAAAYAGVIAQSVGDGGRAKADAVVREVRALSVE